MDEKTKVLVIGGGPGGYVAAIRAAQLGGEVTLVEKNKLGGTCLNVGCIPTKSLLHAADVLETVREAEAVGIRASAAEFDWEKIQANRAAVVSRMVMGVNGLMRANKVKVVAGAASFVDASTVSVKNEAGEETLLRADKIIIASGSVPSLPRGSVAQYASLPACIDSTDALELKEIPARLAVIGGGVIGVELASVYQAFGSKVTIFCSPRRDHILPEMDGELSEMLEKELVSRGIVVMPRSDVTSLEETAAGTILRGTSLGTELEMTFDKILFASGRSADTEGLNLAAAGVNTDKGRILVNDRMETNVPNIYAIGDCLGQIMLAHTASAQGEVAAENALGGDVVYDGSSNPSCVYTNPEYACVGLTEAEARERGIDCSVGRFPFMANGKAVIVNGGVGMVKAVLDKADGRILGLHILGPRATDIISECAFAIGVKATIHDMDKVIHAHPTIAEAVREAVLAADNRAINMPNRKKK